MMVGHDVVDRMIDVWNERDLDRVRGQLSEVLTPDVLFVDPTITTRGLAEFEANVRGFTAKYPDAVIGRASGIDAHHAFHRYAWQISMNGKVVLTGFDVSEVNADGKICRVLGFFGPLPPLAQ